MPKALDANRHVLAVGCDISHKGHIGGLTLSTLERIAQLPAVDAMIIEADGSRQRPFKAPASHEPAIPSWSTFVIPVVGLDVLWHPLCADYVHRPEIVAELSKSQIGATVTPQIVAAVIGHLQGGGKNSPIGAKVMPFLNKLDVASLPRNADEIAELLVQVRWIEQVMLGAVATPDPVWDSPTSIAVSWTFWPGRRAR